MIDAILTENITGWNYNVRGSWPDGTLVSMTQDEFEEAVLGGFAVVSIGEGGRSQVTIDQIECP